MQIKSVPLGIFSNSYPIKAHCECCMKSMKMAFLDLFTAGIRIELGFPNATLNDREIQLQTIKVEGGRFLILRYFLFVLGHRTRSMLRKSMNRLR